LYLGPAFFPRAFCLDEGMGESGLILGLIRRDGFNAPVSSLAIIVRFLGGNLADSRTSPRVVVWAVFGRVG
jgi:hypothetical protein